jgi:hypothetical protein
MPTSKSAPKDCAYEVTGEAREKAVARTLPKLSRGQQLILHQLLIHGLLSLPKLIALTSLSRRGLKAALNALVQRSLVQEVDGATVASASAQALHEVVQRSTNYAQFLQTAEAKQAWDQAAAARDQPSARAVDDGLAVTSGGAPAAAPMQGAQSMATGSATAGTPHAVVPAPGPMPHGSIDRPLQAQREQERVILERLKVMGYSPKAIPANVPGRRGIKSEVRAAFPASRLFQSQAVFDKAWQRLLGEGEIKYDLTRQPSPAEPEGGASAGRRTEGSRKRQ